MTPNQTLLLAISWSRAFFRQSSSESERRVFPMRSYRSHPTTIQYQGTLMNNEWSARVAYLCGCMGEISYRIWAPQSQPSERGSSFLSPATRPASASLATRTWRAFPIMQMRDWHNSVRGSRLIGFATHRRHRQLKRSFCTPR